MKLAALGFSLACAIAAAPASAQPAPSPDQPDQPRPDEPPSPRAPDRPEPIASIAVPEVHDPMLAAIAPPPRLLASFKQAKELIAQRSPDLQIARGNVEIAEGSWREALSVLLPSIVGTASITARPIAAAPFPGLTLPFYTYLVQTVASEHVIAPSAWNLLGTAEVEVGRQRLNQDDTRRRIYGGLADAVLAAVVAERTAELQRNGLRAALETHAIWQRRRALGVATDLDVARLAHDVAVARLAVTQANEALRESREALGLALGFAEGWGVSPAVDADSVDRTLRAACTPVRALDDRADVASAKENVREAKRGIAKAKLDYLPTVDVITTIGMQPTFIDTSPQPNFTTQGLLTWTIWDGGFRYGQMHIAKGTLTVADAQLEQVRRSAGVEGLRALRGVTVASEALSEADEQLRQARETDRLIRVTLASGTGSTLDLVQAQQNRRAADINLALREFDLVRAQIQEFLVFSRCSL